MERIAAAQATGELATGLPSTLPMARTDGRTNGRANHLNEIPSVPNRARFFQSDIDLAVFLATRKPTRTRHEKHRRSTAEREVRAYEFETDNQLAFIRGERRVLDQADLAKSFRAAGYKVTTYGQQATQTETRSK